MTGKEHIYAIIILLILAYMVLLYLKDSMTRKNSALDAEKHFSTASAFWFCFVAFSFLLIFWLLTGKEHELEKSGIGSGLSHAVVHMPRVMCNWLANLSLLMAAIAYSRGKDFNIRRLIWPAGMASIAMLLWVMLWEIIGHTNNLFWTALLIAPELAIANIAMISLGWAFFVRWSGFSAFYLILTITYALLQLPAHLELELDTFFRTPEMLKTLDISFPLMAACQIMLAYGFLSLLCGSSAPAIKIDQPKYWPSGSREAATWAAPDVGGMWAARAVELGFAAVFAVAMHPVGEMFWQSLWQ